MYCTSLHKCLTTGAPHEFNDAISVPGTPRFRMLNNPTAVGPKSSLRDAVDIRRANRRCMTHCCTSCINVTCAILVFHVKRIYLSRRGSDWGVAWTRTEWGRRAHLNRRKLPSPTGFSEFPWQPNILLNRYIYIYIYIYRVQFTPLTFLPRWANLLNSVGSHVTKSS
jgi:hypothetical protein